MYPEGYVTPKTYKYPPNIPYFYPPGPQLITENKPRVLHSTAITKQPGAAPRSAGTSPVAKFSHSASNNPRDASKAVHRDANSRNASTVQGTPLVPSGNYRGLQVHNATTTNAFHQTDMSPPPARKGRVAARGNYDPLSSSSRSTSAQRFSGEKRDLKDPEIIEGVNYFKIGEVVRVRRYDNRLPGYSSWFYGEVQRPVLVEKSGLLRREYVVSYIKAPEDTLQDAVFSPDTMEILSVIPDNPTIQDFVVYAQLQYFPLAKPNNPQPVPTCVWTPAQILVDPNALPEQGLTVLILQGPQRNRQVTGMKRIVPYSPEIAKAFRKRGIAVEGDGIAPSP